MRRYALFYGMIIAAAFDGALFFATGECWRARRRQRRAVVVTPSRTLMGALALSGAIKAAYTRMRR